MITAFSSVLKVIRFVPSPPVELIIEPSERKMEILTAVVYSISLASRLISPAAYGFWCAIIGKLCQLPSLCIETE